LWILGLLWRGDQKDEQPSQKYPVMSNKSETSLFAALQSRICWSRLPRNAAFHIFAMASGWMR
jgi:hypothetical protein